MVLPWIVQTSKYSLQVFKQVFKLLVKYDIPEQDFTFSKISETNNYFIIFNNKPLYQQKALTENGELDAREPTDEWWRAY